MTELEELQASALVLCKSALALMAKTHPSPPMVLTMAMAQTTDALNLYAEMLEADGGGLSKEDRREIAAEALES